ncbi:MAG: GTP 3',8-cyclase MoaA [Gammaproteobacteria bacterium]
MPAAPDFPPSANNDGNRLIDRWGRRITYLRLSVTDRCDFRCQYCMPMKMRFLPRRDILSLEECLVVARVFAEMGVGKIRITGGEPLVRGNIVWLIAQIAALPGIGEVVITTNGSQLPTLAADIRKAGVRRINISLDTLDAGKFATLTRTGSLPQVLRGIEAARDAGLAVKINTVMIRGVNDGELATLAAFAIDGDMDISFIEAMPLGDIGISRARSYYGADEAMGQLRRAFDLRESDYSSGGPARYYQPDGAKSRIGFITPHSRNFCADCNRVRITAAGALYPCLGQNHQTDLRPALRGEDGEDIDSAIRKRIMQTMHIKPHGHDFDPHSDDASVIRFMSATGG